MLNGSDEPPRLHRGDGDLLGSPHPLAGARELGHGAWCVENGGCASQLPSLAFSKLCN